MKEKIVSNLERLKWPSNPQKVLKEKLKNSQDEEKKEVFISINKALELNEIDSHFKMNTEYFS